jgi:hypothetical protein
VGNEWPWLLPLLRAEPAHSWYGRRDHRRAARFEPTRHPLPLSRAIAVQAIVPAGTCSHWKLFVRRGGVGNLLRQDAFNLAFKIFLSGDRADEHDGTARRPQARSREA